MPPAVLQFMAGLSRYHPMLKTKKGKGPSWANSLFEDNAEYGFGMRLAVDTIRKELLANMNAALAAGLEAELTEAFRK